MSLGISGGSTLLRLARRAIGAVLAGALGIAALAPAAQAQTTAVVPATARAEAVIVAPLSFFKVDDLNFGRIIPGTTAGTVVLAPDGSRTATGGARLASGASQPARFAGMGRYNQQVAISISSMTSTLTRAGGGGTMNFDTFIIGSSPVIALTTAPRAFRISSTTGQFNFPVGATLRVKANQAPGVYSGTFAITLSYQ